MTALGVPHAEARAAFLDGLHAFVAAVADLDEQQLLAPSRCAGWTAGDLAVHVHVGLQDMLLGVVSPTRAPPDVDAATYWRAFPPAGDEPSGDHTRFIRLLSSAYLRPTAPVKHLQVTAAALGRAVDALAEGAVAFQGHVLTTGDFLATWAVELAVHHLDLDLDAGPAPAALTLARRTVEALAGAPAADVDDTTLVLAGTGRIPPDGFPGLPVLG